MSDLFQDFSPVSKEAWLAKVEKDLKGKALEELHWHLGTLTLEPFYHSDDQIVTGPIAMKKSNNDWQIGDSIRKGYPQKANKMALQGLMGGVNAPVFHLSQDDDPTKLDELLKDIALPFISTHFRAPFSASQWMNWLQALTDLAKARNYDLSKLEGSFSLADFQYDTYQVLYEALDEQLPAWRFLHLSIPYAERDQLTQNLATALTSANTLLQHAPANQRENILSKTCFSLNIGTSYFVEIARMRALRLLWANLAKAYELDRYMPELEVILAPNAYDDNQNTNMIRSSTQAMAAVIGGADRLIVTPADLFKEESNPDFTHRIARNVQHLLKMESYMDRVVDPAAGSYYIEALTNKLASEAWQLFQKGQ
ncbi:MAG: methylmalonyl-CoA mutase family protein [Saprospiraceae bacterium]|nr:methylmalonyl-CoA mutase family protein [Saprospiraceae bacterium]